MVEKTLKTKLSAVTGFSGKVFPIQAPESCKPPYMVYEQTSGEDFQDMSGGIGTTDASYDIHIIEKNYGTLKATTSAVITALRALQFSTDNSIFYQSVSVTENSPELYEAEINCYRKIVNFKVVY